MSMKFLKSTKLIRNYYHFFYRVCKYNSSFRAVKSCYLLKNKNIKARKNIFLVKNEIIRISRKGAF